MGGIGGGRGFGWGGEWEGRGKGWAGPQGVILRFFVGALVYTHTYSYAWILLASHHTMHTLESFGSYTYERNERSDVHDTERTQQKR